MRMKGKLIAGVALAALACAGAPAKTPAAAPATSNAVVVAIGDAKLMQADIDTDVAKVIEAKLAQIPPEQLSQISPQELEDGKKRLAQQCAEQIKQQFILTTLLKREATKKGITVTDNEVKARADEIMASAKGRPGAPACP